MRHSSSHCSSTISAPAHISATASPQWRSRRLSGARGGVGGGRGVDSKAPPFGVRGGGGLDGCVDSEDAAGSDDATSATVSASASAPSGAGAAAADDADADAAADADDTAGAEEASPPPASSSRRSASPLSMPCAMRRCSAARAARITFGDLLSMASRSGARISST